MARNFAAPEKLAAASLFNHQITLANPVFQPSITPGKTIDPPLLWSHAAM